ncbi:MAG: F0F1 ATP synthase subunit alpha, partial [Deltaproteobacteria bacterium]|nr:F0F1 ATP synthase subunit alpha [Deltaproteobacteria bacterium]
TRGYLDKYPVASIKNYEPQLLSFLNTKYPEIGREIDEKKIISAELEQKLKAAISEFDTVFTVG